MTPATFIGRYPLFREVDPTVVEAVLAQAAAEMGGPDTGVWGSFATPDAYGIQRTITRADVAHGALAADLLVTEPYGVSLGLKATGDGPTIYRKKFDELLEQVAGGFIVAGAAPWPPQAAAAPPPALVFVAGSGTAGVTNGSTGVTFNAPQTLPAGTLLVFAAQPGAYYSVAANITGATSGTLMAPYTGTTNAATTWVHT